MAYNLADKLTYRIMLVLLVMLTVIAGIVIYMVHGFMASEAQERYMGMIQATNQQLRRSLSEVYQATRNNIHDIERDLDQPDSLLSHMERIVKNNKSVSNCALLFVPGYYPEKGTYFAPFATRDSLGVVESYRIDDVYHNYDQDEWFRKIMASEDGGWTDAYFEHPAVLDSTGPQRMMISYAVPIHDRQGRRVALISSDFSLDWLQSRQQKNDNEMSRAFEEDGKNHSYSFIVDRHGTYVLHPDEHRMLNRNLVKEIREAAGTKYDQLVKELVKNKQGTVRVDIDGVPSYVYYKRVKHIEWYIVLVVPESVIYQKGHTLNMVILGIMLVGLVTIFFICRYVIHRTTWPTIASKAAMEQELHIAQNIQMAMLPKPISERKDLDICARLAQAREVGGDLYDYILCDGKLFFCIGDVSGKGVPASLVMSVMLTMFRSEAKRTQSAADIVQVLNQVFFNHQPPNRFVTMFVGILDLTTGHLDYCNAGHEVPMLVGEGQLEVNPNLPIGSLDDWQYVGQETTLHPGSCLFLYTDGLSEAMSPKGELFTRQRVNQLCTQASSTAREHPEQLVELFRNEVHRHIANAALQDDITLLALCWHGNSAGDTEQFRSDMSEVDRMSAFVNDACQRAGMEKDAASKLLLAVEEAVANVINYSQATMFSLSVSTTADDISITLTDDGQPFDPTAVSVTDLSVPADQRPPGGLGIIFMRRMTDALSYRREDNKNMLTLQKRIH